MGNSEKEKPSNSGKSSSPVVVSTKQEQNNVNAYPDWRAMQAFYGPHVALPPYLNSAVASPHAPPPYMWGPPQSMIPPYGGPYAAFYANGGVYAHLGVPVAGTSLRMETLVKPSGNTHEGFMKKLKEFDGLAISLDNGDGDSTAHASHNKLSDSDETEGSSDGSNGVTPGTDQSCKKRSRKESPNEGNGKAQKESSSMLSGEERKANKVIDAIPLANAQAKTVENKYTKMELKDPSLNLKSSPTNGPQPSMQNGDRLLNEQELKRERRKQSNRESARRSRLRKQAEAEELAIKVKALTAEKMTLTAEINKLIESSQKLKHENAALMDKLRDAPVGQREEVTLHKIDDSLPKPTGTVNLLARVNKTDSTDERTEDGESCSPGAKLHQLLDPAPRTDAVPAI